MLPHFQNHKIHFPLELKDTPDMVEAQKQIKYTSWEAFGGHDDFPDVVSQLGMMEIVTPRVSPSSYSAAGSKNRELWDEFNGDDYAESAYDSYS